MASYCIPGGTGFIGSRLIAHLANRGHHITVPTRDPERARHLRLQPSVRIVRADVHAPGTLAGLLAGTDAVINLIGILNESGRDGRGFNRAHVELMQTLIAACKSTGVSRLVQISALNADAPQASSHYLRSKGEAEALLRASRLGWTILQPSVIFGPGDDFLNRFAGLLRLIPLAFPLPMPNTRFAPIHVDDLVSAITRVLDRADTAHQTLQLYGAETFTLKEIVQMIADTLGLKRKIIGMSKGLSRAQAAWMDFVPGKPFSTDNYRSMLLDSVGTEDGLQRLGIRPRSLTTNLVSALAGAGLNSHYDIARRTAGR
jgi:NADH dehydrogenase